MDGWIKLHRVIMDNWVWSDKPFSRGQAWLDLIMMANHKDNKFPFGDEVITVERGSLITSELKLMERWGWSKSKVRYFLNSLEIDSMIVKKVDRKKTTINIVNYCIYQESETTEEPKKDHEKTIDRPLKDTNKNDKNVKNEKNSNIYSQITDIYNSICISYPKLKSLSDSRKKALNARLKTYTIEDFKRLFEMAEDSKFLKGGNDRSWSATFDWLVKDSNMAKVLDGNYKDKGVQNVGFRKPGTNDGVRTSTTGTEPKSLNELAAEAGIE